MPPFYSYLLQVTFLLSCCSNNRISANITNDFTLLTELSKKQTRNKSQEHKDSIYYKLPEGYLEFEKINGDLNGDNINDLVVIVKGTDTSKIVVNSFGTLVDRNRRGILVYLSKANEHHLVFENLRCFSSDQEDGGVYFAPELYIEINNLNLSISYSHGRYGMWSFKFQYSENDFKLTEFFSEESRGPITNNQTIINYLTSQKTEITNTNPYAEEEGDETFEEVIIKLTNQPTYKLSQVNDFREFFLVIQYPEMK